MTEILKNGLRQQSPGVPRRRLTGLMSPWCLKRLEQFGGDISRFRVARLQPSRLRQIAVARRGLRPPAFGG